MFFGWKPLIAVERRQGHRRSKTGQGEVQLQCLHSRVFGQPQEELWGWGRSSELSPVGLAGVRCLFLHVDQYLDTDAGGSDLG